MNHRQCLDDLDIVQIDKTSGLQFLDIVGRIWEHKNVAMLGGSAHLGRKPNSIEKPAAGGGWWEGSFDCDSSIDAGQISTTSGTTGEPKPIIISRRAVSDTVARLQKHMELDSSIREYIGIPVTFSFGLGRARVIAAAGGAAYLPENGFRPDEIALMLRDDEINALSAVPTMLRTILASPEILGGAGGRLRWLEIGSQYFSAEEKTQIRAIFPNAIILQHYGLTEASRSTFLRVDRAAHDQLSSVGRAVDEGKIRIGSTGLIEVAGPHLATSTIVGGRLENVMNDDGWLITNDRGEMHDGWLYYLGRADEVANIGGVKISTEDFERKVCGQSGIEQLGVCSLPDALRGERLAIAVPAGSHEQLKGTIFEVANSYGLTRRDLSIFEMDRLPRTATGKLQRKVLAQQVQKLEECKNANGDKEIKHETLTPSETMIAAIWAEALEASTVGRDDSFYDLGGDSLSAVSVLLHVEKAGLPKTIMQRMFAGETVGQIAAAIDNRTSTIRKSFKSTRADAVNALRGLLAILIVVSHWGPFARDRLGDFGEALWSIISPVLRIGTPGFAMVYGLGLGLFFIGQIGRDLKRARRRMRNITIFIVADVFIIAIMQAWQIVETGGALGSNWPERLLYGVLLFYALMVPSSIFWTRQVQRAADPVFASLLLAVGALALHATFLALFPTNHFEGWSSLAWHMMGAPYAYPRLLGLVAIGLAAGLWVLGQGDLKKLSLDSIKCGCIATGFGILLIVMTPGSWREHAGSLLSVPAYGGMLLVLFSAALKLVSLPHPPHLIRPFIIAGTLAFPIFVGHGLVIPTMLVLEAYGVAKALALAIPLSLFLITIFWLAGRVYRVFFQISPLQ